jgi:hypothetical protein
LANKVAPAAAKRGYAKASLAEGRSFASFRSSFRTSTATSTLDDGGHAATADNLEGNFTTKWKA